MIAKQMSIVIEPIYEQRMEREKSLSSLDKNIGYMDPLTPYAFRKGHADKLDQMVSSVHRRQCMGHVFDNTMQHYISGVSGVDTQSIMLDRPPMQSLRDHLRSRYGEPLRCRSSSYQRVPPYRS
jgi:integrase